MRSTEAFRFIASRPLAAEPLGALPNAISLAASGKLFASGSPNAYAAARHCMSRAQTFRRSVLMVGKQFA